MKHTEKCVSSLADYGLKLVQSTRDGKARDEGELAKQTTASGRDITRSSAWHLEESARASQQPATTVLAAVQRHQPDVVECRPQRRTAPTRLVRRLR